MTTQLKETSAASPAESLDFVIVIPTLNEAESIGSAIDEIRGALQNFRFDVLVVDGRSNDGTDRIALEKGVKLIYQKNSGYGDALSTGFLYVRKKMNAKAIVMMDADLTYDPSDIPDLVKPILEGRADMVVGNRFPRMEAGAMTLTNKIGNQILSWFARITLKLPIHDTQCGLRAFKTELVDEMSLSAEGMPLATEMIADARSARATIVETPVRYRRRVGRTKLRPLKDGFRILGTIIRLIRDFQPLLFFGVPAALFFVIGLFFGIDVTLEWVRTGSVGRLPTVMLSVLLLIGSMQLFTLGLVADMIKRVAKRRSRL